MRGLLLAAVLSLATVLAGCAAAPPACDLAIAGLPADAAPPEPGQPMPAGGIALVGVGEVDWAGSALGEDETGGPSLTLRLAQPAASRVAAWTEANVGSSLAIGLNGALIASPVISAPISGDTIQISAGGLPDAAPFEAARPCVAPTAPPGGTPTAPGQ